MLEEQAPLQGAGWRQEHDDSRGRQDATESTPELGFASAVAEFGLLLRDNDHKGSSTFADVRERASRFKGKDPFGDRAEFIRLIDAAEGVNRVSKRD